MIECMQFLHNVVSAPVTVKVQTILMICVKGVPLLLLRTLISD